MPEEEAKVEQFETAVFIVDDDPTVRNLLSSIIRDRGYSFLVAANGREALSVARAYSGDIQLLLSDVNMPQMSGLDLAKQMIEERPGIRVLMISGNQPRNDSLPFLKKPFSPDELRRKVAQVLSGPDARGSPIRE